MVSVQGMTSPISITTLMSLANASLGTNGYTVASGSVRTYQNALQTALANANNNKSLAGQKTCTPLPSNY
jgi:aspartyl-tRNA synthetase